MKPGDEKIRVLRIINRFNVGGPTLNVAYLSKYLSPRFETRLVGGVKDVSEASSEYVLRDLGIEPVLIPAMKRPISLVDDYRAYRHLRRIMKEFDPHIVHTHASKAGTLGRLAAAHHGVPIVVHTFHGHVFHSYFGKAATTFYKTIERLLARRSDRIIAISEQQKHEIGTEHRICPPAHIEIVPLGFDLRRFTDTQEEKRNAFRTAYGLGETEVAIGIVGRLAPVKNHRMFLEAIATLPPATREKARFFIIGDGELRETLMHTAEALGIPHTWMSPPQAAKPLCFTSWITRVDEVMAGLDIVCLTSLNEGTPVSLIEAQSAGKPVVSTRVGGIGDIVLEGESALLCAVNDVQQFATHLATLIGDAPLRHAMGVKGRGHVSEKYSYRRLVNDMERLYDSLLREKRIIE